MHALLALWAVAPALGAVTAPEAGLPQGLLRRMRVERHPGKPAVEKPLQHLGLGSSCKHGSAAGCCSFQRKLPKCKPVSCLAAAIRLTPKEAGLEHWQGATTVPEAWLQQGRPSQAAGEIVHQQNACPSRAKLLLIAQQRGRSTMLRPGGFKQQQAVKAVAEACLAREEPRRLGDNCCREMLHQQLCPCTCLPGVACLKVLVQLLVHALMVHDAADLVEPLVADLFAAGTGKGCR